MKKLTAERIIELKKFIAESQLEYAKLKEEINFLSNPSADENRLRQMELEIEQEKIKKEQERTNHEQWLEERKKKQIEIEKQLRPNYRGPPKTPKSASESETEQMLLLTPTTPTTPGTSSASPLLTSLLKSSSEASPTRSAPTITNLLTTGSSLSIPSTPIISQTSPSIITASPHLVVQINANINHSASQIPASLTAPTLITLLDKKVQSSTSHSVVDKQLIQSAGSSKDATNDAVKDDEADLLAGFSEVLVKLDDEDLADLDAIIMNPEILDAKLVNEDEQSKDEDSMHATTNDDYDKLKIKQLVEDFTTVEPVVDQKMPTEMETDVIPPSDIENSNPASIEVPDQNPTESNDSKPDEPTEEKVVIISDESSNTNDEKPQDDTESQPSAAEEDSKEVPETSENSGESKEPPSGPVFQVEDSDDDAPFEDAKEMLDNSGKTSDDKQESNEETKNDTEPEKSDKDIKEEKIIDSDDETLGVKASRGGRRKATDTRSRDHSNDDNREATPIRTRSRHSSVIEPKSAFNFTKEQDHAMWKARWDDCVKEMQKLKDYSSIIDKRVIPDDSCKSYIFRPMNMSMIGRNIESHYSTTTNDVKRDFSLMCTNIIMYPNREKVFIEKVQQFLKDATDVIDSNLEVEEAFKSYRKQIRKKHH